MYYRSMFNHASLLQKEMESLFSGFGLDHAPEQKSARSIRDVCPRLNLYATESGYILESPLPGVDEDSIDITLAGNVLTLTADRVAGNQEEEKVQWHRRERSGQTFVRRADLPKDVDAAQIQAEYRHGLLRVTLPKKAEALPKKISVQTR